MKWRFSALIFWISVICESNSVVEDTEILDKLRQLESVVKSSLTRHEMTENDLRTEQNAMRQNLDVHGARQRAAPSLDWVLEMTTMLNQWQRKISAIAKMEGKVEEAMAKSGELEKKLTTIDAISKDVQAVKQSVSDISGQVSGLGDVGNKINMLTQRVEVVEGKKPPPSPSLRCESGVVNSGRLKKNHNTTQQVTFGTKFRDTPHVMVGTSMAGSWDPDQNPTVPTHPIDFFVRKKNIAEAGFTMIFLSSTNGQDNAYIFGSWMACGY